METTSGLQIWTVYDHPTDVPDHFVARLSVVDHGVHITDCVVVFDDIESVRRHFRKMGLERIPRYPQDDPKIVEVWL